MANLAVLKQKQKGKKMLIYIYIYLFLKEYDEQIF